MANIVGLVGIGVSGLALIFAIVALASDNWETIKITSSTIEIKIGLWEICATANGIEICAKFEKDNALVAVTDEQKTSAEACKAMIFLAIFTTTGAIVSAVTVMFVLKEQQILFFVAGGLNLVSGMFLMIAMALYVDKIKPDNITGASSDLAYGFALDILAWLAAWAAGGLFIAAKIFTKDKTDSS